MSKIRFHLLCAAIALVALAGCGTKQLKDQQGTARAENKYSAGALIVQPIEYIDLITLIEPEAPRAEDEDGDGVAQRKESEADYAYRLEQVIRNADIDELERNQIQDRLFMASNKLCEAYKVSLKRKSSRVNFWTGLAATTFGAAGSVAAEASSKYWSALSGVATGTRAEYNQSYFADVATQVITKGINKRRQDIYEAISVARRKKLADYTLELAIADAITYHGACSLIAGLEQADASLTKFSNNAGLDALGANPFFAPWKAKRDAEIAAAAAKSTPPAADDAPSATPMTPPAAPEDQND
jgi:hypothetical protein